MLNNSSAYIGFQFIQGSVQTGFSEITNDIVTCVNNVNGTYVPDITEICGYF